MENFKKGRLSQGEIVQWLGQLRKNAHVPESGFIVTAVFRARAAGADDYYFAGTNVENIDHRLTTHAEEGCLAAMVTGLGRHAEIVEGWVMGAPKDLQKSDMLVSCCGKCRQQIAGFADAAVEIHAVSLNGATASTTVGAFLPNPFTFRAYSGDVISPDFSAARADDDVKKKLTRHGPLTEKEIAVWLKEIESVDYASKLSQAMVLKLDNGAYVAGAKIEEAAFVSMSAAQTALAIAVAGFGACKVQAVWVYTKGRDGKELPAHSAGLLTLSALQTLAPFAENGDIPVRFLAGDGSVAQMTFSGAVRNGGLFPEKS